MRTTVYYQNSLKEAAECLRCGGTVAFPTETVYGLGADATNSEAIAKVFEAKKRPSFDPLIVHVASLETVQEITTEIPAAAQKLMDAFWPGPLTLILPKSDIIPDIVTAGLPGVGVRMPANPIARELIELSGRPLAAPSANLFTHTSPTSAQVVLSMLDGRIDGIVDEGSCAVGIESSVLSLAGERPTLFRPGGVTRAMIEAVIGPVDVAPPIGQDSHAPGRLSKHYATTVPLMLNANWENYTEANRIAQLCFADTDMREGCVATEVLSPKGDLIEAAQNLYAAMRRLDRDDIDIIFATAAPEEGLGIAINDRLKRAASNFFQ